MVGINSGKIFLSIVALTCLLILIKTLVPPHGLASSSDCDVTAINMPAGSADLKEGLLNATVPNATSVMTVNLTTSANSTWKLYSDYNYENEIGNKRLYLNPGSNYAYIKVIAQDNTATKTYLLVVTREAISGACDATSISLPCGAAIGENTITANVPVDTYNLAINVNTSNYASWRLFSDIDCANEISDGQLHLNTGANTAYIKVSAQDNITTKKYTLTINRAATPGPSACDVTPRVICLGQPFLSRGIYPANVWDMQVFDDRIYLGFGNSSNVGPGTNAGPIPIIYFNPSSGEFVTEDIKRYNSGTDGHETVKAVDEEQIDIYKVLNGKLFIPGHDSRESWSLGNYYIMDNNGWQKFRNLPNGIHVYDMAYFGGKFFAAIGSEQSADMDNNCAVVLMSEDNGAGWHKIGSVPYSNGFDGRAYTLFQFKNKLYAVDALSPAGIHDQYCNKPVGDDAKILCIEQDPTGRMNAGIVTVKGSSMVPGIRIDSDKKPLVKMVRTNVANNKLLFIAGQCYNDHQWLPKGLYVAADINSAEKMILPEQDAAPTDTLVRGDTAYVLAYVKMSSGKYTNIVYKSGDLVNWTELFRFNYDTFARSFEELNGDFYFGLGCYTDYLPASTGKILKVESAAYQ